MKPFMELLHEFGSAVHTRYGEAFIEILLPPKLFVRVMQEWDDVLVNEEGYSTHRHEMKIHMGKFNVVLNKAWEGP